MTATYHQKPGDEIKSAEPRAGLAIPLASRQRIE